MATYRRFHKEVFTQDGMLNVSPVNKARILSGYSERPQTIEAVQWHPGDSTRGLTERWLDMLQDGDYIILDAPAYPYVWKKDDFEANTELIKTDSHDG